MNLEEAYAICKRKKVSTDEACQVLEFYIHMHKGKNISIKRPEACLSNTPLSKLSYEIECKNLMQLYVDASSYIITKVDAPEILKDA